MNTFPTITDLEFGKFQKLIYDIAGIDLPPSKKMLVGGRLSKRLRHYGVESYIAYYKIVAEENDHEELQMMVDLLTTNETYFFREAEHFTFLQQKILPNWKRENRHYRVWSAACSSGEESYSLAMMLMDFFGETQPWEITASDLSLRMLEIARSGHYLMESVRNMPPAYLAKYCLKGVRSQTGTFLIDRKVRDHVSFQQINLNAKLPNIGLFDLIFLRNVLIYFNLKTKQEVVRRTLTTLRSGGYFFIGHAESLLGITDEEIQASIYSVAPTIYRKR